ncbi:MAG TPA: hypothetical protein VME01_03835 [Solirubrobacteraceae bacterium]|nr:hypothetical protein [Solirubrobacteraceae bacterium]
MSHRVRCVAASTLVACAALLGPAAAAQASDAGIRATVKDDLPKIIRSQAKILDGIATLQQKKSVTALVDAIRAQDRNLSALHNHLDRESASTASGAKGKTDLVDGLKLIIASNQTLAKDLAKAAKHQPVSKAQLKAAVEKAKKGNVDLNTGSKMLKA